METVSMQIHVGNRELNIKVPVTEKENIIKLFLFINDKISALKRLYSVNDNQDILAMCAFSVAGEFIGLQNAGAKNENVRLEKLESLDSLLNGYLSQPQLFNS